MHDSCAPVRLNFGLMDRSIMSLSGLLAPSQARASAASFPISPLWPLVHLKVEIAPLSLRHAAIGCRRSLLSIPIQPRFSQFTRCLVRPLIIYLESLMMCSGANGGTFCRTYSTALSSATWFVCLGPGTL